MSRVSTPNPWAILSGEDGTAIVVPAATSVEAALTEMIDQIVGKWFLNTNPVICREAATLKIQSWRSCTAQYLEAHGIDVEEYGGGGWWAEDGDGKRSINVLYVDRSLDAIAEEAVLADRLEGEK